MSISTRFIHVWNQLFCFFKHLWISQYETSFSQHFFVLWLIASVCSARKNVLSTTPKHVILLDLLKYSNQRIIYSIPITKRHFYSLNLISRLAWVWHVLCCWRSSCHRFQNVFVMKVWKYFCIFQDGFFVIFQSYLQSTLLSCFFFSFVFYWFMCVGNFYDDLWR